MAMTAGRCAEMISFETAYAIALPNFTVSLEGSNDPPRPVSRDERTTLMKLCAEVMAYSSVVGGGVLIVGNKGKGPMVGQIAYICHTDHLRDKDLQVAMSEVIAKALNDLFDARPTPSADVAALIREAEDRVWERAAVIAENVDYPWEQGEHLSQMMASDATACAIAAAIRAAKATP